jgi:branched-subunit amino acid aminotransferase/4-amino-4-deoxychorismate lyase
VHGNLKIYANFEAAGIILFVNMTKADLRSDQPFSPFTTEEGRRVAEDIREAMTDDQQFELTCAIRYDPGLPGDYSKEDRPATANFFLYNSHFQRLKFTMEFFEWNFELDYYQLLGELKQAVLDSGGLDRSYKLRVLVSRQGQLRVESFPVAPRDDLFSGLNPYSQSVLDPVYDVIVAEEPVIVGPFTSFKTTKRDVYNAARQKYIDVDATRPQEVILYNSKGEITEGSLTNCAFKAPSPSKQWITPFIGCGCICGVVRHHLIATAVVKEEIIKRSSIQVGDPVLLFNGVIGVCRGVVVKT